MRQPPRPYLRLRQSRIELLHRRREVRAIVGEPHASDGKIDNGQRLHPQGSDEAPGRDARRRSEARDRPDNPQSHKCRKARVARGSESEDARRVAVIERGVKTCHQHRKKPVANTRFAIDSRLGERADIEGTAKGGKRGPAVGQCRGDNGRRRTAVFGDRVDPGARPAVGGEYGAIFTTALRGINAVLSTTNLHRTRVRFQSLGTSKCRDGWGQTGECLRTQLLDGNHLHVVGRAQAAAQPGGARSREHVVRAGGVVAGGFGARWPQEYAARVTDAAQQFRVMQAEVFWREAIGQFDGFLV